MRLGRLAFLKKMLERGTNSRGPRAKFCHIANSALRAQARLVAIEVRRCSSVLSRAFDCNILWSHDANNLYIFGGEQVTDQADC